VNVQDRFTSFCDESDTAKSIRALPPMPICGTVG
jgi:hypothetical protein